MPLRLSYHLTHTIPIIPGTLGTARVISAFAEPVQDPPGGNASVPLNVSGTG
ncbi:MAG: hypothetical protein Q8R13_04120 [bacterium]|nr:hypothetical protein [bacterium]MDZ4296484.1 hypothetical protein [Patescibacteria group bacterium]